MFFWKQKWQILINATLSASAHGGRGGCRAWRGWMAACSLLVFFFPRSRLELSLRLRLKPFHSPVSAADAPTLPPTPGPLLANALVPSIGYNCKPLYLRRSFTSHSRSGNSVHFPLQPLSLLHLSRSRRFFIPAPFFLSCSNTPSLLK